MQWEIKYDLPSVCKQFSKEVQKALVTKRDHEQIVTFYFPGDSKEALPAFIILLAFAATQFRPFNSSNGVARVIRCVNQKRAEEIAAKMVGGPANNRTIGEVMQVTQIGGTKNIFLSNPSIAL